MKGASSGTLKTRKGSLGSEVSTTLKVTLLMAAVGREAGAARQGILDRGVVPLGQETGNARGSQTLAEGRPGRSALCTARRCSTQWPAPAGHALNHLSFQALLLPSDCQLRLPHCHTMHRGTRLA